MYKMARNRPEAVMTDSEIREYALQWNHTIRFTGQNIWSIVDVYRQIEATSTANTSSILVYDDRDLCAMRALIQLVSLFDSLEEGIIPCWNNTCLPATQSCFKFTIDRVRKVYDAVTNANTSLVDDSIESPLPDVRSTTHPTLQIQKSLLNDMQRAYIFVLQQWLLTKLWVSCLMHDHIDEASQFPFLRPLFLITIAESVLEESRRLGQAVLEVHGVGMIERLHDIAMGVIVAARSFRGSGTPLDLGRIDFIMGRYFELLGRLRNGETRFKAALQKAYKSAE